ncbi:MAG: hypothetical protein KJS77_08320 [Planctomycetes bacterium]|nr:hypothetical protein [Planctomycetota bacterium]
MARHAIHLGAAWEPPAAAGGSWVRKFGRPTGLEKSDRLVLVCEGPGSATVWRTALLNDRPLEWRDAGPETLECDVTGIVAERNVLAVSAEASAPASGPDGVARAAIPSAWGRLSLVVVSD